MSLGQVGRDLGPLEVERRQVDVGLGRAQGRLRLGVVEGVAVVLLPADRPALVVEDLGPAILVVQPLGVRLGLLERGLWSGRASALNGRGSIWKSTSPFVTSWPSWK